MKREIVKIDEELCNGCAQCIPNCHEGALQIIDGKARLISDLLCDGLGACVGHCPEGAITIEERESAPYDEIAVMEEMVKKGENTVVAHLMHLKEHNETGFLKEGVSYLMNNQNNISFDVKAAISKVHNSGAGCHSGGCAGSKERVFNLPVSVAAEAPVSTGTLKSELTHWPIQLHLINPNGSHFKNSDLVVAADCTAFSFGDFHRNYIKGKKVVIACPKLDDGQDIYFDKIQKLVDVASINTITVIIMEVPCCGGLLQLVKSAVLQTNRKVPVKKIVIGIQGEVLAEEWV
jgi:ferredoxin